MSEILIFAGTVEGRKLAEYLVCSGVTVHVCVATEYGEKLLPQGDGISITAKRLDVQQMKMLIMETRAEIVIDATHPYAVLATENIRQACFAANCEYVRLLRSSLQEENDNCTYVESIEAAVCYLEQTEGTALITTGSKELAKFTKAADYQNRFYARVLSTPQVVEECARLGFEGKNLICMQGPFSEELNYAMLRQIEARYLVTKESGSAGGFAEKINAARRAGAKVVVIGRPKAEPEFSGKELSYEECIALLEERYPLQNRRHITLLGIGMGSRENMTLEGIHACEKADVLVGAERMLKSLEGFRKPVFSSFQAEDIRSFIETHPQYSKIVIALSGDSGFYSGATRLVEVLQDYETQVLPGISSVAYLCARLKKSWQDVKCVSIHGRYENLIAAVKANERVFSLLGGKSGVPELCRKLLDYGLGEVVLHFGERLSYAEERIVTGRPAELAAEEFSEPCAVLIENKAARDFAVTHGLPDENFIRGRVPMTKEEVRSISLSKLRLTRTAVAYDIGAGTGSVAVEMALQAAEGMVYAVEKNPQAVCLLRENRKKFGAENLIIIEGEAPQVMEELPLPTHAFIGGSSGNLRKILEMLLGKNPALCIVINAVTLETLAEATACLKELCVTGVEVVQISVSKAQEVGSYHLMQGQNPVFVISCRGDSD